VQSGSATLVNRERDAAPFTKVATGISRQLQQENTVCSRAGQIEELGWLLVAISTLPLVIIAGRNVVLLNEAEARTPGTPYW